MNQQGRDEAGHFAAKSDEIRNVRSLRLTDTTWEILGKLANERCITRADLLEDWISSSDYNLQNKVIELNLALKNSENNSIFLSQGAIESIDKIIVGRCITREELIISLLNDCKSDNKLSDSSSHTQLDLLPNSSNKSNIVLQPLNNNQLAQRLGRDPSNLKKQVLKGEDKLLKYSASNDPDGVGWKYSQKDKLYYPELNYSNFNL